MGTFVTSTQGFCVGANADGLRYHWPEEYRPTLEFTCSTASLNPNIRTANCADPWDIPVYPS